MRVFSGEWSEPYLDYYLHGDQVRVCPEVWYSLDRVEGLYFERKTRLRTVYNYVRQIGIKAVYRKIRSRLSEGQRNRKHIALGYGKVIAAGEEAVLQVGTTVFFLAYNHPRCVSRLALEEPFAIATKPHHAARPQKIQYVDQKALPLELDTGTFSEFAGWSRFSGRPVDGARIKAALESADRALRKAAIEYTTLDNPGDGEQVREATPLESKPGKNAALLGYGNYAKTIVMPYAGKTLRFDKIYEIDPLQLGPVPSAGIAQDSSPVLRPGETYNAVFIAGYHSTHATIAIDALRRGMYAVVEKPLATTASDLKTLEALLQEGPSKLFTCFHKRYLPMNEWARVDMDITPGDPVSYHCIVYEVPLPDKHWYRWPSSCSRLVSNGCHWIDHFLFLNDYAQVVVSDVSVMKNGDSFVHLELTNGAAFSMVLTDHGSERLGVRDHIELRAGSSTVKMVDGSMYHCENSERVRRSKTINKMVSYEKMYSIIAQRIADGIPGDSVESLYSSKVVLDLESKVS